MACARSGCNNAHVGDSVSYQGVQYGLCANHEGLFTNMIAGAGYPGDMVNDARKLFIVTQNRTLFDTCMTKLVNETAKRNGNKLTWRYRINHATFHLSKELTHYEFKCWFGSQKKIFAGLLSAQEFLAAMQNGYMVKDPGPGPNHGEFSHRLQWHMLMRVMTNDFTVAKTAAWDHSPLQLFCWTGSSGYWGKALEGLPPTDMCPGSPSWVDERLRSSDELSGTSLGRATIKRRNKRVELLEMIADQTVAYARRRGNANYLGLQDGSLLGRGINFPTVTGAAVGIRKAAHPNWIVVDLLRVSEILYAFKKTGRPVKPTSDTDHEAHIAWFVWHTEEKAKSSNVQDYKFAELSPGVYSTGALLNHSAQCVDLPIAGRLANSAGVLR